MTTLFATKPKTFVKTAKKNWLYVQETEAVPVSSGSVWNEGYVPANKFLYFSEAISSTAK